jgi:hypothetical protein
MKKYLLILFLLSPLAAFAQNLQLHYDFGDDRKYYTTTLEMFKPDEYGSTFFFVDMDYNASGNKSVSLSYWEIARYVSLKFIDPKLSATVQYNDGHVNGFPLGQVWLGGFSYPIDLGFATVNCDLLYRAHHGMDPNGQVTLTWYKGFLDNKLSFTGFLDLWTADKINEKGDVDGRNFVLLTEPQLWYNVWGHLCLGGEVEISNNFLPGKNKVQVNPTLGFKWNF